MRNRSLFLPALCAAAIIVAVSILGSGQDAAAVPFVPPDNRQQVKVVGLDGGPVMVVGTLNSSVKITGLDGGPVQVTASDYLTKVYDVHALCRPTAAWDAGVTEIVAPMDAGFTAIQEIAMVPESTCTGTVYFFHAGMTKTEVPTRGGGGARGVGHNNGISFAEGPIKSSRWFCAVTTDAGCWVAGQVGQVVPQ